MERHKKLAILVGGGPAPGINSVIGAATIRAALEGMDVIGVRDGFEGLMQGDIEHIVPLTIEANAPLGEQHIPLKLRYQACNNEVCLPPVTLSVDAVIHVSSGESRPSRPELFVKP